MKFSGSQSLANSQELSPLVKCVPAVPVCRLCQCVPAAPLCAGELRRLSQRGVNSGKNGQLNGTRNSAGEELIPKVQEEVTEEVQEVAPVRCAGVGAAAERPLRTPRRPHRHSAGGGAVVRRLCGAV